MKTKLEDFVNEYGGKNKAAGFRYSEPTTKYIFGVPLMVSNDIDIEEVKKNVGLILNENNVEEEYFKITSVKGIVDFEIYEEKGLSPHYLEVGLLAYSDFELESAIRIILVGISEKYSETEIIILAKMLDTNIKKPERKKLGY